MVSKKNLMIAEALNRISPKNKLLHYTDWDGLMGIMKTQSLWATHYKFLNDFSEIHLYKEDIIKEFSSLVNNEFEEDIKKRLLSYFDIMAQEIYITSFSKADIRSYEDGLLSQWRGYGNNGGFALIFDMGYLETTLSEEFSRYFYLGSPELVEMRYDKEDVASRMKDMKPKTTETLLNYQSDKSDQDNLKLYLRFLKYFELVLSHKHPSFLEEQEIRIVAFPEKLSDHSNALKSQNDTTSSYTEATCRKIHKYKTRKFREKDGVPYIDLFDSEDLKLPIKRIIVGPHKDKEKRAEMLRVMLAEKNMDIPVTISSIPFIGIN